MHICVSILTIIASDNGFLPGQHQAIIWTSAGVLLIGPMGANFSELIFLLKIIHFKMLSGKCRPFCLRLNVLICYMNNNLVYPFIF